ncbi:MAG: hypothetical protein AAGA53_06005 [Pseudomonadota bacterium]
MHQAVKQLAAELATDLDDQELVPSNDVNQSPVNKSIDELREKIKSARLEKLMARQLETELSIDHIEIETPEENSELEAQLVHDPVDEEISSTELTSEMPESQSNGVYSILSNQTGTMNVLESRRTCDDMRDKIKNSSEVLTGLAEQADGLANYLQLVERDLAGFQSAKVRIKELEEKSDQLRIQRQEAQAMVEKQKKQIEMLETMRKSSANAHESAKNEIAQLNNSVRKKDREIGNLQTSVADIERDRNSLKSEISKLEMELSQGTQALKSTREKLRNKDVELTKVVSDLNALSAENEQNVDKFADLQAKYNELNKRGLEQQNQHYSKIHELENSVRELKRQVETNNREKSELAVELSAANNLLVLHEEMISALSPEKKAL